MWLPAVWTHFKTLNFLPSLVQLALPFSPPSLCISPSLPGYFLFSITWMSLFSMERAECPLRVALPCSPQCYFYCSFTAWIHRWTPLFFQNSLSASLSVCLSFTQLAWQADWVYAEIPLGNSWWEFFRVILHAVKWLLFSPSSWGAFPNFCRCTQGQT